MKCENTLNSFIKDIVKEGYNKELNSRKSVTKAKRKYNNEHYSSLQVFLDNELVNTFKDKVKSLELKQSEVIKCFLEDFIVNQDNYLVYEDGKALLKSTSYEKSIPDSKHSRLIEKLSQIKDKEILYDHLHGSNHVYLNMKDLREISEYLSLTINNIKSRSEIMFKIYSYFAECIDKNNSNKI